MWSKIVLVCLFVASVYGQGRKTAIDQTVGATVSKTSGTVCKVTVFCQITLTKSTSSVTVGGTSICQSGSPRTVEVTVGSGSTIPIAKTITQGDYFRAVITEMPNSCTGGGGGGKQPTTKDCKVDTSSTFGSVFSPGYPDHYENDKQCDYVFPTKAGFCGVDLQFFGFTLEDSPGCKKDYLKLADKSYCNEDLKDKKVTYRTPFTMSFKSDSTNTGAGFIGTYKYLTNCDAVCNKNFTATSGTITPPLDASGQYKDSMFCTYTIIKKPEAVCLLVKFLNWSLKKKDIVSIEGVPYTEDPKKDVKTTFADGKTSAEIDFISDATDHAETGFLINYKQVMDARECPNKSCQQTLSGSGILKSPKSPADYPKDYNCDFIIKKQDGMTKVVLLLQAPLALGDTLNITLGTPEGDSMLHFNNATTVTFDADGTIAINFKSDSQYETKFNIMVIQLAKNENEDAIGETLRRFTDVLNSKKR